MSKIVSISTAVPPFRHAQDQILRFMLDGYALDERESRKLRYLYHHSGIDIRYSVIPDYSRPIHDWRFYPQSESLEPFPALEQRMDWFHKHAAPLSVLAARKCLEHKLRTEEITHLITVSCTGMSAPGLDLQVMELMDLPRDIFRTSVNFMGCFAAVHALRMADAFCAQDKHARVLVVCTELCTLHFQREATVDNMASSMLFADGSAAVLVTADESPLHGLRLGPFHGEVVPRGKTDMAWEISSSGFLMTLSGYVPDLIREDIAPLVDRAISKAGWQRQDITHWCVHPGGKRILEAVEKSLVLTNGELRAGHQVLRHYGNMSSPTILFVLRELMHELRGSGNRLFAMAFGPGLTMETFMASN